MKIQAINNTNFRGLFTDKSAQNNGNWKMEYAPYSWERKNQWSGYEMADQKDVELLSSELPDNEKIYTPEKSYRQGRRSCKDILGTEFYYEDFDKNTARSNITEVPSLNREDSLRVYNKKLQKFADMKEIGMIECESGLEKISEPVRHMEDYAYGHSSYKAYSSIFTKKSAINEMDSFYKRAYNSASDLYKSYDKYIKLRKSKEDVKNQITKNAAEIDLLENAKKSGRLIDISSRFKVYDPNKALWEALQNIKTAAGKIVALPHKTISIKEILDAIGQNVKSADIPQQAIRYIDNVIRYRT